ncbi:hypothetical protein J4205_02165, partial [Candidatus Pacearchaeota archaeon]|nr:hypothetical protein [Candidatus Pacearchaeota archaeon]
ALPCSAPTLEITNIPELTVEEPKEANPVALTSPSTSTLNFSTPATPIPNNFLFTSPVVAGLMDNTALVLSVPIGIPVNINCLAPDAV